MEQAAAAGRLPALRAGGLRGRLEVARVAELGVEREHGRRLRPDGVHGAAARALHGDALVGSHRAPSPADVSVPGMAVRIREGAPDDAAAVLALVDGAVAGGPEPFSASERRVRAAAEWAASGGLRVAEDGGQPVGAIVLGSRPPWV